MPTFGRFETTGPLPVPPVGLSVMHCAREAGASGPRVRQYAVKEFRPQHAILTQQQAQVHAKRFLERAEVQEAAAKGGGVDGRRGGHWAPIYDKGESEQGVYYITDLYERSAERLVDQKVRLDGQALRTIVDSVVLGLGELDRACGRAHGNLKATNVLIRWRRGVDGVALTDPAAAGATGLSRADDLRALGGLIFALVMHRRYSARMGWPLPISPEWEALGPSGRGWRTLCEELLDPGLKDRAPSLDELLARTAQLGREESRRIRRRRAVKGAAAGAVAVVLMAGVVLGIQHMQAQREWRQFVAGAPWARPLVDFAKDHEDDFLRELYMTLGTTHLWDDVWPSRQRSADDRVRREQRGRWQEALENIRAAEEMLSPARLRTWPLWERAEEARRVCERRGWTDPGAHLRALMDAITPSGQTDIALRALVTAQELIERINALETSVENVTARNDPVLQSFAAAAEDDLSEGGRNDIVRRIDDLLSLAKEIEDVFEQEWWPRVNHDWLATSHVYELGIESPRGQLRAWLDEARRPAYRRAAGRDPRDDWSWNEQVENVHELLRDDTVGEADRSRYSDALAQLETDARDLDRKWWSEALHEQIAANVVRLNNRLDGLERALTGIIIGGVPGRLAELEADRISESPAVVSAWEAGLLAVGERVDNVSLLDDCAGRLRSFLTSLDDSIGRFDPAIAGPQWEESIRRTMRTEREELIDSILREVDVASYDWRTDTPPVDSGAEQIAAFNARLTETQATVARLRAAAKALREQLDPGAALDHAAAVDLEAVRDDARYVATQSLLNAFERIGAIRRSVDTADLARTARNVSSPEDRALALAAWKRLGDAEVIALAWPMDLDLLELERDLQRSLRNDVAGALPGDRGRAIARELAADAPRRWRDHVEAATAADASRTAIRDRLRSARRHREALNAQDVELSPPAAYSLELLALKEAVLTAENTVEGGANAERVEPELRAAVARFGEFSRNHEVLAADPVVDDLMGRLGLATSENVQAPPDFTQLGPGRGGWSTTGLVGDEIEYTWTSEGGEIHRLTFIRVEPEEGGDAAFVSAEEVSVGLFKDVVDDRGSWGAVRAWLQQWQEDRRRMRAGDGRPYAWEWSGNAMQVRDRWYDEHTSEAVNRQRYASDPAPPSGGHPMHHVSPQAALFMAKLIGCRLPTRAEWEAALALEVREALEQENVSPADGPAIREYIRIQRPNLRDETWRTQLTHESELARTEGFLARFRPYEGSLWGAGDGGHWNDYNDGILWFARVDQGGGVRFRHLVGNVAEWVVEPPDGMGAETFAVSGEHAGSTTELMGTAQELVGDAHSSGRLLVMGASSQSPPNVLPYVATPVAERRWQPPPGSADPIHWQADSLFFTDVGFRLAFSAEGAMEPEPLLARLRRVLFEEGPEGEEDLARGWYLAPESAGLMGPAGGGGAQDG